jgi:TfoX/Sxy family transcriptional regulator of competence genes
VQIPKPTEADKAGFRSVIPADVSVHVKPMFGNLGAFVNGNMFAGLFGSVIGVRLVDDASREELLAVAGTRPFGPVERPMSGYVGLPADWAEQPDLVARWIGIALAQVRALPPKSARPKAAKPRSGG